MRSLRRNKNALLFLSLILFILNVLLFNYQFWKTWWLILMQIVLIISWIFVVAQYVKAVRNEKQIRKNNNKLFALSLVLFFINLIMFDYLSWDTWWVPFVHIIIIALFIWTVILYVKRLHSSKNE
jgi:positive regulator of sigma E activity